MYKVYRGIEMNKKCEKCGSDFLSVSLERDEVIAVCHKNHVRLIQPNNCKYLDDQHECLKRNIFVGSASIFECRFGLYPCYEEVK